MTEVCAHPDAVPVTALTGETVAALCPGCGQQLPAEWIGCDHDGIEVTAYGDPGGVFLCRRCGGSYGIGPGGAPPHGLAGIIEVDRPLSEAEYAELAERLRERYATGEVRTGTMTDDIPPDLAPFLDGLRAPPAPPTVDDLTRVYESLRIRSPRAARLEVGVLALDLLHESVPKDQLCGRPGLAAIWGVPIVPSATLAAGAWRMLDADGEEIAAGDLLCPVPGRTETGETGAMDDDPQPTTPEPTDQRDAPTFSGTAPWGAIAISGEWGGSEIVRVDRRPNGEWFVVDPQAEGTTTRPSRPEGDDEHDAAHVWNIEYEARERPTSGMWMRSEPTGMAKGICSCGLVIDGPEGESLPKDDARRRMREHLEAEGALPDWWRRGHEEGHMP